MTWQEQESHRRAVVAEAKALPREATSRWVLVVVAVCTLAWVVVLAWQVAVLPDRVPQHWSAGDVPDRWASTTEALAMTVVMPLLFAYPMPLLARLVTAWPEALSVPTKEWWLATPQRIVRFERLLREDLWLMAAWMLALLVVVDVQITMAAGRAGGVLSGATLGIVVPAMLAALLGYVAWMYARRYAADPAL